MSLTLTLKRGGGSVSGSGTDFTLDGTIAGGKIQTVDLKGDTDQTTLSGKNKFNVDGDFSFGGYNDQTASNGDGTLTTTSDFSAARSNGQKLSVLTPNTNYILSASLVAHTSSASDVAIIQICSGTRGSVTVLGTLRYQSDEAKTLAFTTPTDTSALWVTFNSNSSNTSATFGNIQIEEGSTATSFEPYCGGTASPNPDYPQEVEVVTGEQIITISDGDEQSQEYTVDLGSIELCKIGTYQDYIYKSGDDWYVHKEFAKLNLADLTFSMESSSGGKYRLACSTQYTNLEKPASNNDLPITVCSCYFPKTAGDTWSNIQGISMSQANRFYIYDNNYNASTSATDYNSWVQTNRPIVYWKLATPTDTQITDSALIANLEALLTARTYNGQTDVAVSSSNLPAWLEITADTAVERTYTEVELGAPFTISDVEGKSQNTTLDGNVYVDWAYQKKSFSVDLFHLTPDDYAEIRSFYDYQFQNGSFPILTIPELDITNMPVYFEISNRNIINQCLLTDKLTLKFRETIQP